MDRGGWAALPVDMQLVVVLPIESSADNKSHVCCRGNLSETEHKRCPLTNLITFHSPIFRFLRCLGQPLNLDSCHISLKSNSDLIMPPFSSAYFSGTTQISGR